MRNKKGKFLLGALVGAGLGLLFAPNKGSKTRKEVGAKLSELLEKAKEIDVDDVRASIEEKIEEVKVVLEDMDKEKALKMAKTKFKELKAKSEELVTLAVEKGTPELKKLAKEAKTKAIAAAEELIEKLKETE